MNDETYILFPENATRPAAAGGKALALAKLNAFPVPRWFVITPEARSLEDSHLQRLIAQAIPWIGNSDDCFAVRSSAVDEDGVEHSFAGQFESYLGVRSADIVTRIRDVWKTADSDRVRTYRATHGLSPEPPIPAVIVQRMINADTAGVAFSADPVSGRRVVAVVSAVVGLGSSLVGGDADSDTCRVDRDGKIIEQSIVRKTIAHRLDPASPEGIRIETIDRADEILSQSQVISIAALARKCARHFGRPQDIEWAMEEGELFLLQSRPITTLNQQPDPDGIRAIWDNSNIAESYGGITTPLTFTFALHVYEGVYRQFCKLMRVPEDVIEANDSIFGRMLGLMRGRVYYNLLNWYRLIAMLPGFQSNRAFMEQMMGVREPLPDDIAREIAQKPISVWRDRWNLLKTVIGLIVNHFTLPRAISSFYARLNTALADPSIPLAEQRLDELVISYRSLEKNLLTRWDAPLVNDFFAMLFFGVLGKLCEKWCDARELQNDLVADEGGIISVEPAKRIREMAELCKEDAELVKMLIESPADEAEVKIASHPVLKQKYDEYLHRFADRCMEELKLESATLSDDPTSLLRAIGHMARRLGDTTVATEPAPSARALAEQRVGEKLRRSWWRRKIFAWVLRQARGRVRDRENLRFERTRLFGRVRRIFVEIGKRLFSEGLLCEPRDVFYLDRHEILGFVEGTNSMNDLRGLTTLRKAEFDRYQSQPAPAARFESRGAPTIGNRMEGSMSATAMGDGAIKGLGCCAGVVRGRVRVIRDPRGAALEAGEILVAERTDPGWIMLFPAAAGILVERGSLLSHSAIVAREMQIPAIVSIPDLTTRLVTGQLIEMDGSAGTVRIVEEA